MLISLTKIKQCELHSLDEHIGTIEDIYVDDGSWVIRFFSVDTRSWLPISESVLISLVALLNVKLKDNVIQVSLPREMIEQSPKLEKNQPVSRKFEKLYLNHFGFGHYWTGAGIWGNFSEPTALVEQDPLFYDSIDADEENIESEKTNLRSANELLSYGVSAKDGNKGHIENLIWNTESWALEYLIIDTRDWLPGGKKVLLPPEFVNTLAWKDQSVETSLTKGDIKQLVEYIPEQLDDPKYRKRVALTAKLLES